MVKTKYVMAPETFQTLNVIQQQKKGEMGKMPKIKTLLVILIMKNYHQSDLPFVKLENYILFALELEIIQFSSYM